MREGDADVPLAEDVARGKDAEQHSVGLEDTVQLAEHGVQIFDVLQHLVVGHQIEGAVGEVQPSVPDLVDRGLQQPRAFGFRARAGASLEEDVRSEHVEPRGAARRHQGLPLPQP